MKRRGFLASVVGVLASPLVALCGGRGESPERIKLDTGSGQVETEVVLGRKNGKTRMQGEMFTTLSLDDFEEMVRRLKAQYPKTMPLHEVASDRNGLLSDLILQV